MATATMSSASLFSGSVAFLPLAPAGMSAGIGLIFLGLACVFTIILAPAGGCVRRLAGEQLHKEGRGNHPVEDRPVLP